MQQIDLIKIYATKHCLLVDDMSEIRGSITRMLRTFGVRDVDTAATGEQAIELCEENYYDMVLCDYNLGAGKDGQQILEELRHRKLLKNTSLFVMITAEAARDMVLGVLEFQPDDYITKPLTQTSLRERLDRALLRHQALYDIKECLDDKTYKKAVGLCDEKIAAKSKYASTCMKMEAELLYRMEDYKRAKSIYGQLQEKKPFVWARLGMGKVELAEKDYDAAEKSFKGVIGEDERYIEAHDLLSTTYAAQGYERRAQEAMQRSVTISPKSILRQRHFAELAKRNNDLEPSIKAYKRAVQLGHNSCHESPQDYFKLAGTLAESCQDDLTIEGKKRAKEAFLTIDKVKKKFPGDDTVKFQSAAVTSRVHAAQQEEEAAAASAEEAKQLYQTVANVASVDASLDYAATLEAMGDTEGVQKLLHKLAAENADNDDLLEKIDAFSDEPVSSKGREKVAGLTKKGISSYEQKEFKEAIETFSNAVNIYGKHVGLNLNLVQVALAESKKNGSSAEYEDMCRTSFQRIGGIFPDNPQYERYQYLEKQMAALYPTLDDEMDSLG